MVMYISSYQGNKQQRCSSCRQCKHICLRYSLGRRRHPSVSPNLFVSSSCHWLWMHASLLYRFSMPEVSSTLAMFAWTHTNLYGLTYLLPLACIDAFRKKCLPVSPKDSMIGKLSLNSYFTFSLIIDMAYRLVKDELQLDGNPALNLATVRISSIRMAAPHTDLVARSLSPPTWKKRLKS